MDIEEFGDGIDILFDTYSPLPLKAMNIALKNGEIIKTLFTKAQRIWMLKNERYYLDAMSVFYSILSEIGACSKASYIPSDRLEKIRPGVEYLHAHFMESGFSSDVLPAICGMSYSYFKKLFTVKFKTTPVKYITALKMNQARDLLKSEKFTITQIAEMLGYQNVYYFSKVFKRETGCSPSQYRNNR